MSGVLAGRVAIVTGAGDGIGRGVARRFAAEGASVLIAERDADSGKQVASDIADEFGVSALATQTDVSDEAAVRDMVAVANRELGPVDILVNNAWGGGEISRVERKSNDVLEKAFRVGYYGPLWAMQAVFPTMQQRGYGRIINLCSLNGVNAHMGSLEYNSAKEALRTLSRTAAREWASYGIVVNVICPGAKSASTRRVFAEHPELEAAADASNPMGRLGDPENDIAPVAVFLASEGARYLTGNTLFVDGGGHINGVSWAPDLPDAPPPARSA